MKRLISLTATLMVLTIFVTSCQKDGVYNPKKKIEKIYGVYDGIKELEETWTWDKNLLTKVAYREGYEYDVFEYDGKQLSKVTSYDEGVALSYYVFTYEKSKLVKIEEFDEGKLFMTISVEHDGKKIVKMTLKLVDDDDKNIKSVRSNKTFATIMRNFLPQPIIDKIIENSMRKADDYESIVEFVYEGDNVSKMTMTDKNSSTSMAYTYDDKLNPFYNNLNGAGESGAATALSKNNPLTSAMTTTVEGEEIKINGTYSYVYDGKYPIEVTYSYKYFNFEPKFITSYEYLK
jgi:hypothetical protein